MVLAARLQEPATNWYGVGPKACALKMLSGDPDDLQPIVGTVGLTLFEVLVHASHLIDDVRKTDNRLPPRLRKGIAAASISTARRP